MGKNRVRFPTALILATFGAAGCSGSVVAAHNEGPAGSAGTAGNGSASHESAGAESGISGASSAGSVSAAGASPDTNCEGACGVLVPSDGWVDGASNEHGIQGAIVAYADSTSARRMESDFTGMNACIKGTAAKVDMASTACLTLMFTPPATDCYGEFWGAAIGMNLNQPRALETPIPFDASALSGFSFELSGSNVPTPGRFRFQVESASEQMFCNVAKLTPGVNVVLFRDLVTECFSQAAHPEAPRQTADSERSSLVKISWHVLTNTTAEVPYDFCVSNVRALPE
jgi:hypothetical protein